jgi:hypothetical protein
MVDLTFARTDGATATASRLWLEAGFALAFWQAQGYVRRDTAHLGKTL